MSYSLDSPVEVEAIRVTFLSMIAGTPSLSDVQLDALPLEHGTSTVLSSVEPGLHTYRLRAMGFGGHSFGACRALRQHLCPEARRRGGRDSGEHRQAPGPRGPPSAQVELFNESGVIGTTTADAQGHFEFTAPLVPGDNTFQARATDAGGNHSLPSEPVTVVSDPAPTAGLTLALDGVNSSDVSLSLSVAGDETDVAGYVLIRDEQRRNGGAAALSGGNHSFIDRGVRNGTYTYQVQAFNDRGFRGPASNAVTATVAATPPAAPVDVTVEPLPSGGALSVSWAPGDARTVAYRVERAVGAEGPFEVLAGSERVLTTQLVDLPLSDSTLYRYRILAFDALENLSSPSLIVTGVPVDSTPPAPPRLMHPTVAGKPVTVSSPTVAIAGFTEPGTQVTLLRNGVPARRGPCGCAQRRGLPLGAEPCSEGGWLGFGGWSARGVCRAGQPDGASGPGCRSPARVRCSGPSATRRSSPSKAATFSARWTARGHRGVLGADVSGSEIHIGESRHG